LAMGFQESLQDRQSFLNLCFASANIHRRLFLFNPLCRYIFTIGHEVSGQPGFSLYN